MPDRVAFFHQYPKLPEIINHHTDVEFSLRSYFNCSAPGLSARFANYIESEVADELQVRLAEQERITVFNILSSLEAAFRVDFLQRCYKKKKDLLSKGFRELHNKKGSRVALEDEILEKWKEHTSVSNKLIGDLKGAFKYRHWLAH
mgnify:FL=1